MAPSDNDQGGAPSNNHQGGAPSNNDQGGAPSNNDQVMAPSDNDQGGAPSDNDQGGAPSNNDEGGVPMPSNDNQGGKTLWHFPSVTPYWILKRTVSLPTNPTNSRIENTDFLDRDLADIVLRCEEKLLEPGPREKSPSTSPPVSPRLKTKRAESLPPCMEDLVRWGFVSFLRPETYRTGTITALDFWKEGAVDVLYGWTAAFKKAFCKEMDIISYPPVRISFDRNLLTNLLMFEIDMGCVFKTAKAMTACKRPDEDVPIHVRDYEKWLPRENANIKRLIEVSDQGYECA
jgi:hypothetical protein